jgi:hypothetical protein
VIQFPVLPLREYVQGCPKVIKVDTKYVQKDEDYEEEINQKMKIR